MFFEHGHRLVTGTDTDRKSTRLNSSHSQISYAVFCLKKKKISDSSPKPRILATTFMTNPSYVRESACTPPATSISAADASCSLPSLSTCNQFIAPAFG